MGNDKSKTCVSVINGLRLLWLLLLLLNGKWLKYPIVRSSSCASHNFVNVGQNDFADFHLSILFHNFSEAFFSVEIIPDSLCIH